MKIKYRGKTYEAIERDGKLVSKDGKILFALTVDGKLLCGEKVEDDADSLQSI